MEEFGVEGGALLGLGEVVVKLGEEFGGFGAVKVGFGFGGLGAVLGGGGFAVEPEGEDAVPVAGTLVEGGDVAVKGEVAGAEGDGLVGRGEEDVDEGGEAGLSGRFACREGAGGGGQGVVVTGGFRPGLGFGCQSGEGVEFQAGTRGRSENLLRGGSGRVPEGRRLRGTAGGDRRRCGRGR